VARQGQTPEEGRWRTPPRRKTFRFSPPRALELIRDGGLSASSVTTILGAAGGPKWLVLAGLDRRSFSRGLPGQRFRSGLSARPSGVAVCRRCPGRRATVAHETLKDAYIHQRYDRKPSPQDITDEAVRIMDAYLTDGGATSILANPGFPSRSLRPRTGPFSSGRRPAVAAECSVPGSPTHFPAQSGRFFVRSSYRLPKRRADERGGGFRAGSDTHRIGRAYRG